MKMTKGEIAMRIKLEMMMDSLEKYIDKLKYNELNDFYEKAKNDGMIQGVTFALTLLISQFPEVDWSKLIDDNPKSAPEILAFLMVNR